MSPLEKTLAHLRSPQALEALAADPYWPKWDGPWWRILLLTEMGLAAQIPRPAVDALVAGLNSLYVRSFPLGPEEVPPGLADLQRMIPCHCQLGCVALVLHACGREVDGEAPWIRPWLLRCQLPDGGLNCDEAVYRRPAPHSSVVSTLPPLEAVLRCTSRPFTPEEERFLDAGAEYLIARRLCRSLSKGGAIIDPSWLEPCFPRFYDYDVLRGLGFLAEWSRRRGKPLPDEAIAEVRSGLAARLDADGQLAPGRRATDGATTLRRAPDGTWLRGQPAASFELLAEVSAPGRPSPWLTHAWRQAAG